MKKIAVVLCGSGFKDGSEIRESVAVLWGLSRLGVQVQCFAPDKPQADVVNCLTGKAIPGENRNMLVEAARIARGEILPLTQLKSSLFDAIIIPGGFGVAKNLCTFATEGSKGKVLPEFKDALISFHAENKPIGAVCIAPAAVAMAFPGKQFEMTVGGPSEAAEEIVKLGHKHFSTAANEIHIDRQNKIVTTAAYMCEAPLHEIFEGVRKLTEEIVKL
ncbi:MAG: isoprenoid biosynthesis protein ElbB [Proteobacteria bacterium]|nr:isoprenoid biosynthesis protein ElbB [Pseudomonadota bacterium]NBY19035.1 isoprenoid biosynthesis protein ElbB [bacterium]